MSSAADRCSDAAPGMCPAWYRALTRRVRAVTNASGRVTMLAGPMLRDQPATHEITVLCANLWHDWPRHARLAERLEAFARLVEVVDADILLLQEVARTRALRADTWLAQRLGLALASARANGDAAEVGFEEGPAILSSFPMADARIRRLSYGSNPFIRRVALATHVEAPSGKLLLVSAHLGLIQRHNAGQIRRLRSWVNDMARGDAAVIGGDFNAPEHTPEITKTGLEWTDTFRDAHPHADATTHSRSRPFSRALRRRLDYVYVQQPATAGPWQVLACRHLDAPGGPHSDHRAVLVRLAPPAPQGLTPAPRGAQHP